MLRRILILTEGNTDPNSAKTASSVIRYRPDEVVAVLDSTQAGRPVQELLNVGGSIPIVSNLDEAEGANTLLIGIAPLGGKVPESWRQIILDAIARKMDIVSGLHEFLGDDPEFLAAATKAGVSIQDVRRNQFRQVARKESLDPSCLRVHTVGHDCSVGKMVTAIELSDRLQQAGVDAKFVATGQTGIMIEGDGLPIDCVTADFISGAAEQLVLDNQHHEVLLIEGQGSLVHPSYSGVTLGLLHGCAPQAMILCYELGRENVTGLEHVGIPPLASVKDLYETMASVMTPSNVIGIAMNSQSVDDEAASRERERIRAEFGLPVCDVIRHGSDELVTAIMSFKNELTK